MKKFTALLLVLLLLASLTISCTKNENESTDSNTVTTQDGNNSDNGPTLDLPEGLSFGGQDVRILVRTSSLSYHDYVQNDSPSLVEMAVFDRNVYVSNLLDVNFVFYNMNGFSDGRVDFCSAIRTSSMSGGDNYHIVVPASYYGTSLIIENVYVDLAKTEYIYFEQDYWWDGFMEAVTINGKVFMATGDYSIDALACMEAIFFNKTLASQLQLENPYELVENGNWTMEAMLNMASKASYDEGNDGVYDRYGLTFGFQGARCIPYSGDGFVITKNGNGTFQIANNFDRIQNMLTTVLDSINTSTSHYYTENGEMMNAFISDRSLFMMNSFEGINKLKSSNVDYGILIYPKYDADQKDYITGVCGDTVCAIVNGLDDESLEMAGATLQALMYASYVYTTPAYFEATLRGQIAQDEESYYMLERIRGTVKYDISMIFSDSVKGSDYFTNCMPGGKYSSISSWYGGVGTSVEQTLSDLINHPIFE